MTEPDTVEMGGTGAPGSALPARALKVFVAPGALFDELRANPRWIGALVLAIGLTLLVTVLIPGDVFMEYVRGQMARRQADIPQDALERGMQVARITRYVGPVVGTAIGAFLISGLLFLVFELGMGGDAGYKPVLASTSHALLIPAVGSLVTLPVIIRTGDLAASLSLDLLFPGMGSGYVGRLLHGMNFFGLWAAVVLGIAMARIYPKRSPGGSIAFTVGLYVAFKAVFALTGVGAA
ncbi:MAG TPA: hypothetical protein VKB18_11730 [Gemmatimonadota bacterium]|nr:hypothetical protein [Gemmatimonadota bacterium]